MDFFCYHRDRPGSASLRSDMVEQHWDYMDRFAATMVARGPTFADDGTPTGSVHVLGLPDPAAARAFAFEEPGYQAGAYRDVMVRRWHGSLDRIRWERGREQPDGTYFLVLGFTLEPAAGAGDPSFDDHVITGGTLLSDDGSLVLGVAALVEAADAGAARDLVPTELYVGVEVHRWRFGGRPG